jgi:hypothetical protein
MVTILRLVRLPAKRRSRASTEGVPNQRQWQSPAMEDGKRRRVIRTLGGFVRKIHDPSEEHSRARRQTGQKRACATATRRCYQPYHSIWSQKEKMPSAV